MKGLLNLTVATLAILLGLATGSAAAQVVTTLHSFRGGPNDGAGPGTSLLQIGDVLYGMTNTGGSSGDGTIYRLATDGTGYGTIYSFAGFPNDGGNPYGSLVQSNSALYGTTYGGGSSCAGTIFKAGLDGTAYGLVRQFAGGPTDGAEPEGSLAEAGGVFYGTTSSGGAGNSGTIFKVNADNTGYKTLYSFGHGPGDGARPIYGKLVVAGNVIYGMTGFGGSAGSGTIFRINTDGTGYAVLHSFTGGSADGSVPLGSLTLVGSTLYGMTAGGGASNQGVAFRVNTDGSGFQLVHSFTGGPNDGASPAGELLLSSSRLYGMTENGGQNALGALFGMNLDGTGFDVLYSFAGGPSDGANPFGDLVVSGATLYGTTNAGGSDNLGTVFGFTVVPEPSSLFLLAPAAGAGAYLARLQAGRLHHNLRHYPGC